jgi:hypothetical protein
LKRLELIDELDSSTEHFKIIRDNETNTEYFVTVSKFFQNVVLDVKEVKGSKIHPNPHFR